MITNVASRRNLLGGAALTLSAAGVAALLDGGTARAAAAATGQDVQILNAAIALEHEGIAAYQLGAESGLLTPDVVKLGLTFQSHHKTHRDELMKAVRALGGAPVEPKSNAEYAKDLNAGALKSQADVLRLALKLERGAANAYLGLIPSMGADFHQVAARMAGDETFHAAILGQALGEPIPAKGLMFG